jgi:endonuclease YncB( thermonuclease family)
VPVSLVVTAADRLVPARRQVKLARSIPSAVVHVVDGDHLACGTEPNRFAPTLVGACTLVAKRARRHRRRQAG